MRRRKILRLLIISGLKNREFVGTERRQAWQTSDGDHLNCDNVLYRGAAEITSHPRILPSVVRRPDDTRKTKRQARLERKAAEKLAREEETRRLKGEKRREIEKRLEQLRREIGEKALDGLDLDKDWDEEEHDKMMGRMMEQDGDVSVCVAR